MFDPAEYVLTRDEYALTASERASLDRAVRRLERRANLKLAVYAGLRTLMQHRHAGFYLGPPRRYA